MHSSHQGIHFKIEPALISSVLVCGQWLAVQPGSFKIGTWQVTNELREDFPRDIVEIGDFYPDGMSDLIGASWVGPGGSCVTLPLSEIKAYRHYA